MMLHFVVIAVLLVLAGVVLARPGRLGFGQGFPGSTLLGFALLSTGMTWPLVLRADWMMVDAGAGPDAFIGVWNLWWTREALLSGRNPFFTDMLFAPGGTSLALHTHAVTYGVLTLPFQLVFGSTPPDLYGVYNLVVLLSFTLTGYFTYRFAFEVSRHRAGSLLAGIAFAFSVYRFANTVRLHALATEWFVLAAWAGWRWIERPSLRRLVLAAASGFVLAHASLEYTAYVILFWICLAWGRRAERTPAGRGTSALRERVVSTAGLVLLAVMALPLATQLFRRLGRGGTGFDPGLTEHFSADLLDFFLPNPRHPIWGDVAARIAGGFHRGDSGFGTSFGLLVLALFVLGAAHCWRARHQRRWMYTAGFFLVLALGPRLHFGGNILQAVPLPQAWFSYLLPFLAGSRTPIRYVVPAGLALALTIAVGWALWCERRSRTRQGNESKPRGAHDVVLPPAQSAVSRLEMAVGAGLLFVLLPAPLAFTPEEPPGVYQEIRSRAHPAAGTLLHVPGMPSRESLLAQTVHRQRLIEDVGTAIPLHDGSEDGFRNRAWEILAIGFAEPDAMKNLDEARRKDVIDGLREYLRKYDIDWIVVPASASFQSAGTGGRVAPAKLGAPAYAAYRENLRWLEPTEEREIGSFTLFAF